LGFFFLVLLLGGFAFVGGVTDAIVGEFVFLGGFFFLDFFFLVLLLGGFSFVGGVTDVIVGEFVFLGGFFFLVLFLGGFAVGEVVASDGEALSLGKVALKGWMVGRMDGIIEGALEHSSFCGIPQ